MHTIARYAAGFTPHRYEAGSAILSDTAFAGATIGQVDWAVDAGSGTVSAIHLNSGTVGTPIWTQVGGVNPTSPITGLTVVVAATSIVKISLTPVADALQSASPTFDWLMLTPQSTAYQPRPTAMAPLLMV